MFPPARTESNFRLIYRRVRLLVQIKRRILFIDASYRQLVNCVFDVCVEYYCLKEPEPNVRMKIVCVKIVLNKHDS